MMNPIGKVNVDDIYVYYVYRIFEAGGKEKFDLITKTYANVKGAYVLGEANIYADRHSIFTTEEMDEMYSKLNDSLIGITTISNVPTTSIISRISV